MTGQEKNQEERKILVPLKPPFSCFLNTELYIFILYWDPQIMELVLVRVKCIWSSFSSPNLSLSVTQLC